MHLLPSVAIQPNLEFKTRPKQLLGSLPLVIALTDLTDKHLRKVHALLSNVYFADKTAKQTQIWI